MPFHSILRFGRAEFHVQSCNGWEGYEVRFEPTRIHFGRALPTTGLPCVAAEALDGAVSRATHGVTTWSVDGRRLRLRDASGGTLVYEAWDWDYPRRAARTLASGEHAGWRYRVYTKPELWGLKLGVTARDAAGRPARGTGGAPEDPARFGGLSVFSQAVADAVFVGGFAPRGTVRVTHRAAPGAPAVTLPQYDVPGSRAVGFGTVVAAHPRTAVLTAYGKGGTVLASSRQR